MKRDNRYAMAITLLGVALFLAAAPYANAQTPEIILNEDQCITVLQNSTDWQEKQAACRGLRQVGTDKSIPVLAALLPDDTMSHMARYALEAMPSPEAGKALRDGLAAAKGMPKMGIIITLGERRDAEAVPLLTPVLTDADPNMVRAATGALGRIATPDSVKALMDFRGAAPEAVRPAVAEGLLAAGQRFVSEGQQKELTLSICQALLDPTWPEYVRTGAFREQIEAAPEQAQDRLMEALKGDVVIYREIAAQVIAETTGPELTKRFATALPALPVEGQAALLRGLAARGDALAYPAVAQAVKNPAPPVKLAAVKALGFLGGAADVPALTPLLLSKDAAIAAAVRVSLDNMKDEKVNTALADAVPAAKPEMQVPLIELLASRRAPQSVPTAVACLDSPQPSVRIAALAVLAQLGGKEQTAPVIAALKKATDEKERNDAEQTLGKLCARSGAEVLPLVVEAMNGAPVESHVALLRMLSRIGGADALQNLLAAQNDADAAVKDVALSELSNWPTIDAAPHLLTLAQGEDAGQKVLGLRGYVRLARANANAEEKATMLTTAMGLAQAKEDKWLVLAAWGTLFSKQSLDVLLPCLDNAEIQDEAASAVITVAQGFGKTSTENKAVALDALKVVLEKCQTPAIRDRAAKAQAALPM